MESVSLSGISLLASSKPLKPSPNYRHLRLPFPLSSSSSSSLKARCFGSLDSRRSLDLFSISFGGNILRSSPMAPVLIRFASISNSAAFSGSGGGDGPPGGGGGGGGGDYGSSGGAAVKSVAGESEEVLVLGPDVIVLHVGGMSCGGCAASVKRILESQPQVSSATVSLETETAYVWAVPEVKVTQDWQQQLGEKLATHLTTCGFKSGLKDLHNLELVPKAQRSCRTKLDPIRQKGLLVILDAKSKDILAVSDRLAVRDKRENI